MTAEAGYQVEFYVLITGLGAEVKAESFRSQSMKMIDTSKLKRLDFQLLGSPREDPTSLNEATALLR